jgi:hypothetical protein
MNETHIYLVTNIITGIQYVGASTLKNRNYRGSGKLIKEAHKEFGKSNFTIEILETIEDPTNKLILDAELVSNAGSLLHG